jgi:hypothetical protein
VLFGTLQWLSFSVKGLCLPLQPNCFCNRVESLGHELSSCALPHVVESACQGCSMVHNLPLDLTKISWFWSIIQQAHGMVRVRELRFCHVVNQDIPQCSQCLHTFPMALKSRLSKLFIECDMQLQAHQLTFSRSGYTFSLPSLVRRHCARHHR